MSVLRWVNIILSMAATWLLVATLLRRWAALIPTERWVALSIVGVFVTIGYGSAEALHQDVTLGARVALMSSSLLSVCVSLSFNAWPHLLNTLSRHQRRH